MMPDICFMVFAHLHHVCQSFGTHTAILWQLLNPGIPAVLLFALLVSGHSLFEKFEFYL